MWQSHSVVRSGTTQSSAFWPELHMLQDWEHVESTQSDPSLKKKKGEEKKCESSKQCKRSQNPKEHTSSIVDEAATTTETILTGLLGGIEGVPPGSAYPVDVAGIPTIKVGLRGFADARADGGIPE